MKIFKRDNQSGKEKPAMYKVTCSNCGKDAEVPFKPTGDRPIFCSDCFAEKKNTNYKKSSFSNKQMHDAVCAKCGNKCEVPFRPTGGKPIYCKNCFEKGPSTSLGGGKKTGQPQEKRGQFEILNAKLDKILEMLNSTVSVIAAKEKKAIKKIKTPKAKKTAKKPAEKTAAKKKPTTKKKKRN